MISFKRMRFEKDIIITSTRWYLSYPLSYRNIEEMMKERGIPVDHSTINRWVLKYTPEVEKNFRKYKKAVGTSWRLDETYVKIKGKWRYLYRAVDKEGNTIDFLLTHRRNKKAALRFLKKAIKSNGKPFKVNIDKSGANKAALDSVNNETYNKMEVRQVKYLNNIVEQDHRRIKRLIDPMMGFQTFKTARITLAGIEICAMLKKGQCNLMDLFVQNPVEKFHLLAN